MFWGLPRSARERPFRPNRATRKRSRAALEAGPARRAKKDPARPFGRAGLTTRLGESPDRDYSAAIWWAWVPSV